LSSAVEEKEESRRRNKKGDYAEKNQEQEQEHQHLSLSTQAYKLFSDRKTPLELTIALNLGESEVTKFYKEYWKLKNNYII
jgi:hypothetical protein